MTNENEAVVKNLIDKRNEDEQQEHELMEGERLKIENIGLKRQLLEGQLAQLNQLMGAVVESIRMRVGATQDHQMSLDPQLTKVIVSKRKKEEK